MKKAGSISASASLRRRTRKPRHAAPHLGDAWAAVLAHEVNNSLEVMQNALFLLARSTSTRKPPAYELLQREMQQLTRFAKEVLSFQPGQKPAAPTDLNRLVAERLRLLRPQLRRAGVRVVTRFGRLPRVVLSADAMQRVVTNLVLNARDSMLQGGELRVETSLFRRKNGACVRLRVADTGCGVPPELLPKIFLPFVTTKGKPGTGLGLWIVRQIVEAHGGRINARSRPRRGAAFEVEIPVRSPAR